MTAQRPDARSVADRAPGVVGILGGIGLLAAFVVDIPPAVNTGRLILFCVGGIAIAAAIHGRQAALARRLALAGTVPVIVANGWSIAWILLAVGREQPFAGDFGLVGFWAGLAVWLAAAWLGLVALRIGAVWRPSALVLAVGSLLAITGMDRLGLTSGAHPTIFGPVSLLGIALNGLAWVLLGAEVVLAGRRGPARQAAAPGTGVRPEPGALGGPAEP